MIKDYMAILNLNENETNIKSLTQNRPLASIPIGGRYRIIDFVLSNMVNSGIHKIGVFTQSKARSLVDHLGSGKSWDLDRKINGLFVFNFGVLNSFLDDIEMFKNNMEYFYKCVQNKVILAPSYMVCNIDYKDAIKYHESHNGDITIIYKKIDNGTSNFLECDVLNIDENNRVLSVGENIGIDNKNNISMEMFLMDKETLINLIHESVKSGECRNLKDAIYKKTSDLKIMAYEFKGYLQCVNSINTYYKANMDMLEMKITNELFFNKGLIYTKVKDEPPTKYAESSKVSNSLIANGCVIEGNVENCIIGRRVKIEKGAVVKNCIIMQNSEVKADAVLSHIIIDKNVSIGEKRELKGDKDFPLVIEKKTIF